VAGKIRGYRPADREAVVELAIRAWAPVFASLEEVLGREMFRRLHGDSWEDFQRAAVRGVLDDPEMRAWVAEAGTAEAGVAVTGFVAARTDAERRLGEIVMVAVDPGRQGRGIGGELTEFATEWLREQGMRVPWWKPGAIRGTRRRGMCTSGPGTGCCRWRATSRSCERPGGRRRTVGGGWEDGCHEWGVAAGDRGRGSGRAV
jgi:GNAT superfamily N-acetyltransferase